MSFFIRGKEKNNLKRKNSGKNDKFSKDKPNLKKNSNNKMKKNPDDDNNEEIDSDDEVLSYHGGDEKIDDVGSDQELETPQEKRLRLAKKYLEEIEKQEKTRAEEKNGHVNVTQRLNHEYLDSIGKLRRRVADHYIGFDEKNIKILKHKSQKLPITCICLSADNEFLFTGSKASTIVKWSLPDYKPVATLDCANNIDHGEVEKRDKKVQIVCMALTTDFKFLAVGVMSNKIRIYCPKTLTHIKTFKDHRDMVTGLVMRRDTHEMYSASKDRSVIVWSLDEMAKIEVMYGHQSALTGIDALARDRAITSGGTDCTIRIWKITEESQLVYNGHSGSIDDVKLLNEENFLSCGDDGSLSIWSAIKKKPLCTQTLAHGQAKNGEANWISAIATYLNTDLVASGSCDGFIRVWKLTEYYKKILLHIEIPVKGFVNCLTFTNDGNYLIAGIGQEHKSGRWWRIAEAKNNILVIPLLKKI